MAKIKAPTFKADQFTATQWDSADTKAKFANKLAKFILAGFPRTSFDKKFYSRLSQTFGHIAHYNQNGFYEAQFSSKRAQIEFLMQLQGHPCYGDPTFTYSDVERAIKAWLRTAPVLESLIHSEQADTEKAERAQLAHLQAKYPA